MSVESLHAARRMFAIIDGEVILAKRGTTEGHKEWFLRRGWLAKPEAFEAIVRGFWDGRDLYAYRGEEFSGDRAVETALVPHLADLRVALPFNRVYLGMKRGPVGERWKPLRELVTAPPAAG